MCAACALLSSGSCKACSCFSAIGPVHERGCILLGSTCHWFMLGVQGDYDWVRYKLVIMLLMSQTLWEYFGSQDWAWLGVNVSQSSSVMLSVIHSNWTLKEKQMGYHRHQAKMESQQATGIQELPCRWLRPEDKSGAQVFSVHIGPSPAYVQYL